MISQDGEELESAVSFSVTGMALIETIPFARPRTIAGVIRSDGSIFSGEENFDVSHSSNTGTYRVTFKPPFSMVMPDQRPKVEIIPNPGSFSAPAPIDDPFAFDVIKNARFPGYYTIKFKPELNVTLLLPIGLQIEVIDLSECLNTCDICSCQCSNDNLIGRGVIKQNVDRTGFTYRTYVETFTERIYTDLPVTFTAILDRR